MIGPPLFGPGGVFSHSRNYDIIPVPEYTDEAADRQEWELLLNKLDREIVCTIERDGTTVALLVE